MNPINLDDTSRITLISILKSLFSSCSVVNCKKRKKTQVDYKSIFMVHGDDVVVRKRQPFFREKPMTSRQLNDIGSRSTCSGVYLLINRDIRTCRDAYFRDTYHPLQGRRVKSADFKVGCAFSLGRYLTATSRNVDNEIAMLRTISMIFRKVTSWLSLKNSQRCNSGKTVSAKDAEIQNGDSKLLSCPSLGKFLNLQSNLHHNLSSFI